MKKLMAKGTLYLMFAESIFLLSGYVLHIGLARMLGPASYGILGVVLSLLTISEIFILRGVPEALAKFIAESKRKAAAIFKEGFKIQIVFSLIFFVLYFFFAQNIAYLLNDPGLTNYIRAISFIIPPLAIFVIYSRGFLGGIRSFKKLALIKAVRVIFKLVFAFLFVFLGLSIFGVIFAHIISAFIGLILAKRFAKIGPLHGTFKRSKLIRFAIPIIISALIYSLLKNVDLLFIKALLLDNSLAGFYTSASTLSRITYSIFLALPPTLLPSISKSISDKNTKLTQKYISQSLRYLLMLILPASFLISATSSNLVALFYSSTYIAAAPVLSILIFASMFLTFFVVLNTVIIGSGKPHIPTIISIILLFLVITLHLTLIPVYGMIGAAISSTIAVFVGMIISAAYVFKKFRTLLSPLSIVRIAAASFVVYLLALSWQLTGIFLIITYAVMFLVYLGILFITKEIKKQDIKILSDVLPPWLRKKPLWLN